MESIYQLANSLGYTHPLHPPLTAIPLGLLTAALVFFLLALLFRMESLRPTARHCVVLAFISVFPTVFFGFLDWQHYYAGQWMHPIRMKMGLAAALLFLLLVTVLLDRQSNTGSAKRLILYFLCFAVAVTIGWYGGQIVFGSKEAAPAAAAGAPGAGTADYVTYQPISKLFHSNCTRCHSGASPPKGLVLSTYADVMKGANGEPVVVPGKPKESELMKRVRGISTPQMPYHSPPLPEVDMALLELWIAEGAPGPASAESSSGTGSQAK